MQIKLDRFCSLLNEAEEEKSMDDSEVSPYLLENLLYPYLEGKDIRLDELDYSAFTLSDMNDLFLFVDDMETVFIKTRGKAERLLKSSPASRPARAFC